jgi:DNA-binding response OmpR family regulator
MTKRILAVDDERHIVRLLQIHFTSLGYEVVPAYDGEEALRQVAESPPDLMLLDVTMPKMDGFAVLRRLKADPGSARVPVIMLTARGQFRDMAEGYAQGAEWYFHKPFDMAELEKFVARVIGPAEPADGGTPTANGATPSEEEETEPAMG